MGLLDNLMPGMPENQQYTGGLLGALAASGALMEASRGQPGGGHPSWGQGLGAAMRAGAGAMQGYQHQVMAGQAAQMQAAQQALQLRGALDQMNARRQLAGMQPLTPADIARNPWAASGSPAVDAGIGGMAGGGVPAEPPGTGDPRHVTVGAFPSREQAMRQASLWGLAGDPAMAKMMQDYGMGGLDKFELNQDGSMRPIAGGPQDPGTIRNKAAAEKMMVQGPNGSYAFAPGVVQSEAGLSGAKAGADAGARLPFAIKEAGAKASIDLNKMLAFDRARLRDVTPGSTLIGPAAGGGMAPVYQSPEKPPGSAESKLNQGLGDLQAATIKGWKEGAEKGKATLDAMAQFRYALASGAQTGSGANFKVSIGRGLTAMGVPEETVDQYLSAKDIRTADAASNELTRAILGNLGPGVSNTDRDFIMSTVPLIKDSPAAASQLSDFIEARARSSMEKFDQGYTAFTGQKTDPLKFEQDWIKKGPPLPDSVPRPKTVDEAQALPPGTVFFDPTGHVRRR